MFYQVNLADLAYLDEDQRNESLGKLAEAAVSNGAAGRQWAEGRVKQFEERYEMTSEELLKGLADETVRETSEIVDWLFFLNALQEDVEV